MSGPRFTDDQVCAALRNLEREVGYPSTSAWDSWEGRLGSSKGVVRRFGSWGKALARAGVRTPRRDGPARRFSDAELLDALRAWQASTGAPPTSSAWDASALTDGRANSKTYRSRFGTWTAALERAGMKAQPGFTSEPRFSPLDCANALRQFFAEKGESPSQAAWPAYARRHGLMSEKAIARRLGDGRWNQALETAGLPTRAPGQTIAASGRRVELGRNRQMVTAGEADAYPQPWAAGASIETIGGRG